MSMLDRSKTYYAVKMGSGKYVLRHTCYREQLLAGDEHPRDVVAVGFAADDLRRVVSQVAHTEPTRQDYFNAGAAAYKACEYPEDREYTSWQDKAWLAGYTSCLPVDKQIREERRGHHQL